MFCHARRSPSRRSQGAASSFRPMVPDTPFPRVRPHNARPPAPARKAAGPSAGGHDSGLMLRAFGLSPLPPGGLLDSHISFCLASSTLAGPVTARSAPSFVAPAPEPGPIPDSRHRRSRWRTGSTAETAARTEAGPRIGVRGDGWRRALRSHRTEMCACGRPGGRGRGWASRRDGRLPGFARRQRSARAAWPTSPDRCEMS